MRHNNYTHMHLNPLTLFGVVTTALALSACAMPGSERETNARLDFASEKRDAVLAPLPGNANVRGGTAFADQAAQQQIKPKVMRYSSKSWVGAAMMPVNADDKLPASFSSDYVMSFADGRSTLPLTQVTARLAQMVGIPVRITQDVYSNPVGSGSNPAPSGANSAAPAAGGASGGSSAGAAAGDSAAQLSAAVQALAPASANNVPLPSTASNNTSAGVSLNLPSSSVNWRGTLTGFLDHITDQLGLSWEYRDGSIYIMRFTTATYELATFPNGYNYTINSGSTGSTTGQGISSSSQLNVAEQGAINGLTSLISVVKKMVEGVPGSEVIVADGSGRLVVRTSKDMQGMVREFIRAENANMLKQVQIQMDIYSVSTNSSNELGVDWTAFYRSLSGTFSLGATSPTTIASTNVGSVTATILPATGANSDLNRRFGDSRAVINALNQIGNNVQHRPISLIALNRQWARKARLNTTGYLSETKPSVASALGGGTGLPGLTTSSITTGDQYAVMPLILDNNTVMLKMGLSLSDLLGLFEVTTGSGDTLQRVQTPNTSAISDQYTIALKPGEVMAITGLSRDISQADKRTMAETLSLWWGGSKTSTAQRENFIVFVRAIIL
ncbi:type II secretion system protein GspD [Limnobacter sp.]|uniref:type II secretion system protein GspD n=1 Tax=Limnobacter sp. TaxID=2003368 RepID=UPI00351662FA